MILSSLRQFPATWEPVFTVGNDVTITADEFLDDMNAVFSSGQVNKDKEIYVYKLFCDFILTLNNEGRLETRQTKCTKYHI